MQSITTLWYLRQILTRIGQIEARLDETQTKDEQKIKPKELRKERTASQEEQSTPTDEGRIPALKS